MSVEAAIKGAKGLAKKRPRTDGPEPRIVWVVGTGEVSDDGYRNTPMLVLVSRTHLGWRRRGIWNTVKPAA
jgi:hypothetical protein